MITEKIEAAALNKTNLIFFRWDKEYMTLLKNVVKIVAVADTCLKLKIY